jgi:hypothetical protein
MDLAATRTVEPGGPATGFAEFARSGGKAAKKRA